MKIRFFSVILLAGALLLSCKENNPEPTPGPDDSSVKVTIPSDGPMSPYLWCEGDQVRIGDKVFDIKDGSGTKVATLNGSPEKDSYYTIAYPGDITGMERFRSYDLTEQWQGTNGGFEHLIPTVFIEDVTSLEELTLSKAWATSKGGTFHSNGTLAFNLTLPEDVNELESLVIESPGIAFPTDNAGERTDDYLKLNFMSIQLNGAPLKAYLSVAAKNLTIPADKGIKLTINATNSYTLILQKEVKMGEGLFTEIKVSDASAWLPYSPVNGKGTEASPYILLTAQDVEQMPDLLVEGKTTWFELGDDIDMSSVLNWVPLNTTDPFDKGIHFDGKMHTITNLSCSETKYPSFFGVLDGLCQNVTFENAEITSQEYGSSMGVVGGYAGSSNGAKATVENVHVRGSRIASTVQQQENTFPLGGLFGTIVNTTIKNCSFEGTIDNQAYGTGTNPDRCATGGIAGKSNASCSITGCTSAGNISSEKCRYIAGIVGWVAPAENTLIKDCTNEATITGGADRAAGIAGHFQQGTIENCVNKGNISCQLVGNVSGAGGIVGYSGPATIIGCTNEGNVTGTKNAVGGIIGYAEMASTIERCSSTGAISGDGRYIGGIAGGLKVAESSISNCWSGGSVTSTKDQEAAGILGSMMTEQKVSCCFSTAAITAQRVAGGIVGRAANNTWTYTGSHKNTVEKCIVWCPSIKATLAGDVNSTGGSGAVVGFTSFNNTLTDCWRRADLDFSASDTANNVLCDQPNCSPTSPYVMGTTPGTAGKYGCPYHGKAATATATVSSIAVALGWSSDFWDFSNDLPILK